MRVLFVTNAGRYNFTEPLGLMYLTAVLRQAGHDVHYVPDTAETAKHEIAEWKPGIVGYSVTTGEHVRFLELNRELKRQGEFFSIFGGPHPTFFPEMIEEDGVDGICRGEGEEAMVELAEALGSGASPAGILNLHIKDADGVIHKNGLRPLIDNLDRLPYPDREGFYTLFNRGGIYGVPHVMASRGCPFSCTYCFNREYFRMYKGLGKRVRVRSPESVVDEICGIVRSYPVQRCIFRDDLFPTQRDWLEAFRTLYKGKVHLPFSCNLRPEVMTAETCRLLREAGCDSVAMGIESGDEAFRRKVMDRQMSNEQIREACRNMHEAGIRFSTNNVIGMPGETIEMAVQTLRLNIECRPAVASTFFFQPYPGTEAAAIAHRMGYFDGKPNDRNATYARAAVNYKIPNVAQLNRLRALMAPAVGFPVLAPAVPFLIRLPLGSLYAFFSRVWVGYCFKFRLLPVKMGFFRFVKATVRYLFAHSLY